MTAQAPTIHRIGEELFGDKRGFSPAHQGDATLMKDFYLRTAILSQLSFARFVSGMSTRIIDL
jgi:hypothetical protein